MPFRKAVLSLAVLLFAFAPLALAQGTYTQIDYPGAIYTEGAGIDAAGDIVGTYIDTSNNYHGFLLSKGAYSTIDYPDGGNTYPLGVNDNGQIVGNVGGETVGFFYDEQTQTFTTLSDPRGSATQVLCINNYGIIGGGAFTNSTVYGFAIVGSTYRVILPPSASLSNVIGITDSGELIVDANTPAGINLVFSYANGSYTQMHIPSKPNLEPIGANPQGTAIVGWYNPSSTVSAGFLYRQNVFTTLEFPGSTVTYAYGVNKNGEVVGMFEDSKGNYHGYTWTPPADAAKK
jgi:probable HAF family extracellular repeat protein